MDRSFLVEAKGKLILARVFRLRTRDDVEAYSAELGTHVGKLPSAVLLADHRPVVIYPQDVADRLVELFMEMNTRLERVAIVVARTNATLSLQLERLVREAAYANRRVVHAPDDALVHLAPSLSRMESAHAREFLAGFEPRH